MSNKEDFRESLLICWLEGMTPIARLYLDDDKRIVIETENTELEKAFRVLNRYILASHIYYRYSISNGLAIYDGRKEQLPGDAGYLAGVERLLDNLMIEGKRIMGRIRRTNLGIKG